MFLCSSRNLAFKRIASTLRKTLVHMCCDLAICSGPSLTQGKGGSCPGPSFPWGGAQSSWPLSPRCRQTKAQMMTPQSPLGTQEAALYYPASREGAECSRSWDLTGSPAPRCLYSPASRKGAGPGAPLMPWPLPMQLVHLGRSSCIRSWDLSESPAPWPLKVHDELSWPSMSPPP